MLTKIVNYNDGAIRRQKNFDDGFSRFCTMPVCDGRTDGIAISISRVASMWIRDEQRCLLL